MVTTVKKLAKKEHSANEAVHVEQGQLLRKAESDQCVLKVKTQGQRDTVEFAHSLLGVSGIAIDELHRRRQDSDLEDVSFDRNNSATMTGPNLLPTRPQPLSQRATCGPGVVTLLSTRSESVVVDWTSGNLMRAGSRVRMRQQRSHC